MMGMAGPLILAALLAGCTTPGATPATVDRQAGATPEARPTTAELVAARQAGMHMTATLLFQGIVPRAKGVGDLKDVHYSEGIELWAAAIPGLFSAGSAHPHSRALPTIWADKAAFDRKAADMGDAARGVTAAGKAGDLAAYAAAAERLRQTCGAGHTPYRAERN